MQPYLYYGYGIRAKNLPEDVKERLIELNEDMFCWFAEDSAGSTDNDAGIYYLIGSSPWNRKDKNKVDLPWADDLASILNFRDVEGVNVTAKLEKFDLMEYAEHVEFICSVTEI